MLRGHEGRGEEGGGREEEGEGEGENRVVFGCLLQGLKLFTCLVIVVLLYYVILKVDKKVKEERKDC